MSYQIDLDVFSGPMDLLLYLISKEEVDISEVSIARIVDQYLAYMEKLEDLNVDNTSDFVVMASTLILIKSKAMLPTEEIDIDEEIGQQDDLIQHLLEYKKIKILSRSLQSKADHHGLLFPRSARSVLPVDDSIALEEVNLWDILRTFAKIVRETGLDRSMGVIHSEKPITAYICNILDVLKERSAVTFESLFHGEKTRDDAICIFIGLLELVKRKVITVLQEEGVNRLYVALCIEPEALETIKEDGEYRIERLVEEEEEEEEPMGETGLEEPPEGETALAVSAAEEGSASAGDEEKEAGAAADEGAM